MDQELKDVIGRLMPVMDEKNRRTLLGAVAASLSRGGISELLEMTGVTYTVLRGARDQILHVEPNPKGRGELQAQVEPPATGRRASSDRFPGLNEVLESMMGGDPDADPDTPFRWTNLSVRQLTARLEEENGIHMGFVTVSRLMESMGYRLQMRTSYRSEEERKAGEVQYAWIADRIRTFLSRDLPVVVLEQRRKTMKPVSFGLDRKDVEENLSIRPAGAGEMLAALERWWEDMGRLRFPQAERILIVTGSSAWEGKRQNAWMAGLQKVANRTGLHLFISLIPPGSQKWLRIEQQLVYSLQEKWQNDAVQSIEIIVSLLGRRSGEGPAIREPEMPTGKWIDQWNREIRPEGAG